MLRLGRRKTHANMFKKISNMKKKGKYTVFQKFSLETFLIDYFVGVEGFYFSFDTTM